MIVLSAQLTLYCPTCHSLKDKRSIVKSIVSKTKRQFNVSVAEVDALDAHQTIVLGLATVSNSRGHAQQVLDEVARFVAGGWETEGMDITFFKPF